MTDKILNGLHDHFDMCEDKYGKDNVWVVMLYGSQNYKLDRPESDVDTKAMVFPKYNDVILGHKMNSTDLKANDGSLCNCKDYRFMFQNYLKGNINFLETLYTKYLLCPDNYYDLLLELRDKRDDIVDCQRRNIITMAAGMAQQKYIKFNALTPDTKHTIEQYGYDPKQLREQIRLYYFIRDFINTGSFEMALIQCYNKEVNDFLVSIRQVPMPLDAAERLRDKYKDATDDLFARSKTLFKPNEKKFAEMRQWLDEFAVKIFNSVLNKG